MPKKIELLVTNKNFYLSVYMRFNYL